MDWEIGRVPLAGNRSHIAPVAAVNSRRGIGVTPGRVLNPVTLRGAVSDVDAIWIVVHTLPSFPAGHSVLAREVEELTTVHSIHRDAADVLSLMRIVIGNHG